MFIERPSERYAAVRIPGIVLTERGTLISYYECRKGSKADWAEIDIKIVRSIDRGKTFSEVCVILSCEDTLNNPVMVLDGEILHFFYCKNYRDIYYMRSSDDGVSFSEPRKIEIENADFPYTVLALGPGHGIIHKGTLIIPSWFALNLSDPKAHRPSIIKTLYSDDGAKTFKLGETIGEDLLVNPSECALSSDGETVFISIRNENEERLRAVAKSDTGTSAWRGLRFEKSLQDPICFGSMIYDKDRLVHINCDSMEARVNLTVKVSVDGAESFHSEIVVDKLGGYSDIAADKDNLYVVYERGPISDGGICFSKIRKTWI